MSKQPTDEPTKIPPTMDKLRSMAEAPTRYALKELHGVSSCFLHLCNLDCPLRIHMPFERTCHRMIMRSTLADALQTAKENKVDMKEHGSIPQLMYALAGPSAQCLRPESLEVIESLLESLINCNRTRLNRGDPFPASYVARLKEKQKELPENAPNEFALCLEPATEEVTFSTDPILVLKSKETVPEMLLRYLQETMSLDDTEAVIPIPLFPSFLHIAVTEYLESGFLAPHALWPLEHEMIGLFDADIPSPPFNLLLDSAFFLTTTPETLKRHLQAALTTTALPSAIRLVWEVAVALKQIDEAEAAMLVFELGQLMSTDNTNNYKLFFQQRAACSVRAKHLDTAIRLHNEVVEKSREAGNGPEERDALSVLHWIYSHNEDWEKALDCSRARVESMKRQGDVRVEFYIRAVNQVVQSLRQLERFDEGIELCREMVALTAPGTSEFSELRQSEAYRRLSWTLELDERWTEAKEAVEKALEFNLEHVRKKRQSEGEVRLPPSEDFRDSLYLHKATFLIFEDKDPKGAEALAHLADEITADHSLYQKAHLAFFFAMCKEFQDDTDGALELVIKLLHIRDNGVKGCEQQPWLRSPKDLLERVIYAPNPQELHDLVETAKGLDVIADCVLEGISVALRVCYKAFPERGKIRVTPYVAKAFRDHEPKAGVKPYRDLVAKIRECVVEVEQKTT